MGWLLFRWVEADVDIHAWTNGRVNEKAGNGNITGESYVVSRSPGQQRDRRQERRTNNDNGSFLLSTPTMVISVKSLKVLKKN